MANAPVEFDQRKLFDQSNPLLKATLTNILSFSNDVAGGLGTLLEFLKVLKISGKSVLSVLRNRLRHHGLLLKKQN